jgi:chloramphenicol O-acetyltransferase type A
MPPDPHPVTTEEPRYLDLSQWPRRESFEYFRHYDKPYFNICTRVDVAPLRQALQAAGRPCSVMLACHHLVLRCACQIEPLRYRIEQGRVRIHDALDASITVLRDDQSLGFALLRYRGRCANSRHWHAPPSRPCERGACPSSRWTRARR